MENKSPQIRRAALNTLGCRLNQSETEAIRRALQQEGYQIVPWGEEADLFVLNSCTVTAEADRKNRQSLRALRRNFPEARLALVGCFAQTQGEQIAASGLADVVVGNQEKMRLPHWLAESTGQPAPLVVRPAISKTPFTMPALADLEGNTRSALKIQDGCDFMCAFCIIPTARGRARPRQMDNLLEEARAMAETGVREVVLTGVNIGTWSEDGSSFARMLDHLAAIPGLARIRISSIEPTTVEDGILERMADPAHPLTPFLHLPLQSGSDAVLTAMRRRHARADYRAFAERALRDVPGLCLGTDVMVGFPGESEQHFEETRSLLVELPFAYFHVFPFSGRKGTPAFRSPEQVPAELRQRRAALLRTLSEEKRLAFHNRFLGETREVLFERPGKNGMARGTTDHFIKVEVAARDAGTLHNQLLPVRLLESGMAHMAGELVTA